MMNTQKYPPPQSLGSFFLPKGSQFLVSTEVVMMPLVLMLSVLCVVMSEVVNLLLARLGGRREGELGLGDN